MNNKVEIFSRRNEDGSINNKFEITLPDNLGIIAKYEKINGDKRYILYSIPLSSNMVDIVNDEFLKLYNNNFISVNEIIDADGEDNYLFDGESSLRYEIKDKKDRLIVISESALGDISFEIHGSFDEMASYYFDDIVVETIENCYKKIKGQNL